MITKFAVGRTIDPMPEVMEKLFDKCEVIISQQVLEMLKKIHSYTAVNNVYTFYRRIRGTNLLFSFVVTKGLEGNTVTNLECIVSELGIVTRDASKNNAESTKKVYFFIQGEEES